MSMEHKNLKIFFTVLIVVGVIVSVLDFLFFKTVLGFVILLVGFIGGILLLLAESLKAESFKEFHWSINQIGLLALVLIIIGIILHTVFRFWELGELIDIANSFVFWGFFIGVLYFLIYVFREKW